jgi:hypothetical protein
MVMVYEKAITEDGVLPPISYESNGRRKVTNKMRKNFPQGPVTFPGIGGSFLQEGRFEHTECR